LFWARYKNETEKGEKKGSLSGVSFVTQDGQASTYDNGGKSGP
jgi:hypothetical protein